MYLGYIYNNYKHVCTLETGTEYSPLIIEFTEH